MDRKARAKDNMTPVKADTKDFRNLRCTSVSCGIWEHTQSGVVFLPFFTLEAPATITFKSKAIVVETDISQRLEVISQTVESVVWEGAPTYAMTLTLREAPRISVCPDSTSATPLGDINSLLNSLFVDNHDVPDKKRVIGLDKYHEEVAGSCLVYRFMISKGSGLKELTRSLNLTRGLPSMVQRNIMISQPSAPYAAQFKHLLQQVSTMPTTLPFSVKFQLQKLAQNGYLSPRKVVDLLPEVRRMVARSGNRVCVNAIRRLFREIPYAGPDTGAQYFGLHNLIALLRQIESELVRGGLCSDEPISSDQVAIIHKVTVTPSGVYLYGPDGECNNRVLRKYAGHHDFFLRVQFCDEDGLPVLYNRDISNKPIFQRFKKILNEGIPIAGHRFSFLGFSHSSLRSQSCWFMAPFIYNGSLIYHDEVIKDLGNFSEIRTPARCAARIGQAFSDTRDAITFAPGIVKDNKDLVDVERNGRVFSDGVGTISQEALEDIWDKLPPGRMKPTVLQIRYQGAKGVIALDSRLKGKSVFIRPSMTKFRGSTSNDVEICTAAYKANEFRLNEQLIKILEDMDVEPRFFLDLQAKEIKRLQATTSSTKNASRFLKSQSIGDRINLPRFLEKIQQLQLPFQDDNFLTDVVEAAILTQLRTLKYKARIPVEDGFTLLGILDETGILEEGQIFWIIDVDGKARVITGKYGRRVIITRSPALHPGDVQLATAIAVPESSPLMQLRNCICFSQKGPRDLPSKLSGGDLDGDTFHIIFDSNARTREPFEPADYARQAPRELNRPVKRQDMTDFFVDFMETDQLGRICNVHKMLADQSDQGVNDKRCIKLAEMASIAVDFSKTGIPVTMTEMPRYSRFRPHFMAPGPHVEIMKDKPISFDESRPSNPNTGDDDEDSTGYRYYHSDKVLGKLFDAIDEQEIFQRIQHNSSQHALHRIDRGWDRNRSLLNGVWNYIRDRYPSVKWDNHLDLARGIRDEYENSLLNLMFEYGPRPHLPLSEIEVFIGDILGKTGALTTRQRDLCISMKERFADILSFTVEWIRGEGYDHEDKESKANRAAPEHSLELSIACLWVALNEGAAIWESKNRTSRLMSFGYVAAAVCLMEVEHFSEC